MTIREAIETNLLSGSLLGYPMVNTRVTVVDGRWSNIRSKNPLIFQQGITQLCRTLLKSSNPCLLEPFMNVEITLPDGIVGEVLSDVSSARGGHILGIKSLGARFIDDEGAFD